MATYKTRSMSAVLLIWLLLPSECSRQEEELDKLIMEVDKVDASKDDIVASDTFNAVSNKATFESNNSKGPDHVCASFLWWKFGDESGITVCPQIKLELKCPLGEACIGVDAGNGGLEVTCAAGAKLQCQTWGMNLNDWVNPGHCTCAASLIPCDMLGGHIQSAGQYAMDWLGVDANRRAAAQRGLPEGSFVQVLEQIIAGDMTGWTLQVSVAGGAGVGGKIGVALGTHEDSEHFLVVGGGASGKCGVEVTVMVYIGFKPDGKAFKIQVSIPHFTFGIKITKNE